MGQYYISADDGCKLSISRENVDAVTHIMSGMDWSEIAACKRFMCPRAVADADPVRDLPGMFSALGFVDHMCENGDFVLDYLDTYASYSFGALVEDVLRSIAPYVDDDSFVDMISEEDDSPTRWLFRDGGLVCLRLASRY